MTMEMAPLVLVIAATGVSAAVALVAWRRREMPGAPAFAVMMTAAAWWALAYAIEVAVADLPTKLLWAKIEYLGIVIVPPAWFLFARDYAGRGRGQMPRWLPLVALEPVLTLALVWTNDQHGLFWSQVGLYPTPLLPIATVHGPWIWLRVGVAYLLLGAGTLWLLRTARQVAARHWAMAVMLGLGLLAPWLGNVLYFLRLSPWPGHDPTPVMFALTGVLFSWGLFRLDLLATFLGLVPVARDAIIAGMPDSVLVLDDRERLVDLNPAAEHLLGAARASLLGQPARAILTGWPETGQAPQPTAVIRTEISRGTGETRRTYDLLVSPLSVGPERVIGRLVVVREITEQVRARAALQASEERYRTLVENASEIIYTLDLTGRITSINRAGEQALGYRRADLLGMDVRQVVAPVFHELIDQMHAHKLNTGDITNYDIEAMTKTGHHLLLEVSTQLIIHAGRPVGVQGIARDVTERRQWQAVLEHQALHDSLTGLPNRVLLHDRLNHALSQARREDQRLALLVLDLDRFKEVNDTFGHGYGDLLLQHLKPRLQAVLRESDTIARLGGDEFAVLLPGADGDGARLVADRLLSALAEPMLLSGHSVTVGGSIGIVLAPEHGTDGDTLLRRADVAMYTAKRAHGGWAIYAAQQDYHSPSRLALPAELRAAIEQSQLVFHYQPQAALGSGRILGAEALIRWQHPRLGLIWPDQFMPLVEELGLTHLLSQWALTTAVRQCHDWRAAGYDLGLAVNLAASDLHDPALVDRTLAALAEYQVAPATLEIELTENSLLTVTDQASAALRRLAEHGVRVAIDDFGTGYSSLTSLQRLPLSTLKIDKSFILPLTVNSQNAAIVRSTIGLGHDLGLAIVAEGIEDVATWDLLASYQCDIAQGYYLSRPLPLADFNGWLTGSRARDNVRLAS